MDLQPTSELLKRHPDLVTGKRLLIAGQLLDYYPLDLAKSAKTTTICITHAGLSEHYQKQIQPKNSPSVILNAIPELNGHFDIALLYIPKAKQEADYWINLLLPHIDKNGEIVIVGENRGGINAAVKLLAKYHLTGHKIDAARRCSLIYAERGNHDILFDESQWIKNFQVTLVQGELNICSMPGVFNHGKLDQGTDFLLKHLPPLEGKGLDFGCGAGIIAAALSLQKKAHMTAVDVSALATHCTSQTFAANQLDGDVICSDGLSAISDTFDFIVSNPPFHLGVNTQYETTRQFIATARQKLTSQGQLWLVTNSFLPYQSLLEEQFPNCQIIADNRKFRVYCCKPR
ncbi:MAG: Ribosomal RNA small subunit methyltransferase C [Candidatus Celerinatantimonas neptuna]|nr:MAG: Ribosomal RNA small subunit methyltransferase C [Candidatus Celerinatantimonas neptuna]